MSRDGVVEVGGAAGERSRSAQDSPLHVSDFGRGFLAVLGRTFEGTRSLVLGRDARAFTAVTSYFGGVAEELPLAERPGGRAGFENRLPLPLPYPSGSFDTVVLNGVLERAAELVDRPNAAEELLREARRVLAPRGVVLVVAENRIGIHQMIGARHPVALLPGVGLLTPVTSRVLGAGIARSLLLHRPRTRKEWLRLLESQALHVTGTFAPWPSAPWWTRLAHADRPPPEPLNYPRATWRERAASFLLDASSSTRAVGYLPPDFVFWAGRGSAESETVLSLIAEAEGLHELPAPLRALVLSQTVAFSAGEHFYKIPTTSASLERLRQEAAAPDRLAGQPSSVLLGPTPKLREVRGVVYGRAPLTPAAAAHQLTPERIGGILDVLATGSTLRTLGETDLWRRLESASVRQELDQLGEGELLSHLLRELASRRVRAGATHGDLHLENILSVGGDPRLIDWEYYEPLSPQFLDVLEASTSWLLRRPGKSGASGLLEALSWILEGEIPAALAGRLSAARADLSEREAAAVFLMHRLSWRMIVHPPRTTYGLDDESRRWATCARALLGLPARRRAS